MRMRTLRCVHKWALLYGMKLIWFVVFASCARGLRSSGMISGKVWPLPTNLNLFFKSCITFNGCFCLVRSKKDRASESPNLQVSKLTVKYSLHCILAILLSAQQKKILKLIWVMFVKTHCSRLYLQQTHTLKHPIQRTLLPVLICHHFHWLSEELSLFLQLTADQSSFVIMLLLRCMLWNEESLRCTVM